MIGRTIRNVREYATGPHPLIVVALAAALYLQRFGLSTSGGAFVSLGHLVVPVTGLLLLARRSVVIDAVSLMLLLIFVAYGLAVATVTTVLPRFDTTVSLPSLILVSSLYLVLCLRPARPNDAIEVLRFFNRHMTLLSLLGVAQFGLQFIDMRFFSFEGLVPPHLLIEQAYNVVIPLQYGSELMKSNGVFFLEPSIFSQFAAIALIVEVSTFRRPINCAIYCAAIFVSYSGSGPLVIISTLAFLALFDLRWLPWLVCFMLVVAAILLTFSQIAPDVYEYYAHRALEIGKRGTSGHTRYITPFLLLDHTSQGSWFVFGSGPGSAEKFRLPTVYTVNALVKMLVDYGLVGAAMFFLFFFWAFFQKVQNKILLTGCICWFFLGGGYQLTSFVVHTMAALLIWAAWRPESAPRPCDGAQAGATQ